MSQNNLTVQLAQKECITFTGRPMELVLAQRQSDFLIEYRNYQLIALELEAEKTVAGQPQ